MGGVARVGDPGSKAAVGAEDTGSRSGALGPRVFAAGAALAAVALSADLIGLEGLLGARSLRAALLSAGMVTALTGAVLDWLAGERAIVGWLKALLLDRQGLMKFAAVTIQLLILALVIRSFNLESVAFHQNVLLLTVFGFVIHHCLPNPYRLAFFLALSLAAITGVFGLINGGWLIGIGLALVGICHLPIRISWRVVVLLLAGAGLTALRVGLAPVPWSKAIWPIVASMFMFRLISYLYDLAHRKAPVGVTRTLSYFFLLPNVAFPLFPVVDYASFCRTYYDDEPYRIYQKGIKWMLWGVVHLILYRFVNYYVVIAPEQVTGTPGLVRYMVANYASILRVTGQFHLVLGMLHLFGFNLPRIMHLFGLASGFTDYWRRVNVYWKDFILKICYYPLYLGLRRWGATSKMVSGTLASFALTWFLHAYQWFWIRGSFLLSVTDMLFWACLALLVLSSSLYEAKHGRKRALVKQALTPAQQLSRALGTTVVFVVMCVLWSLWTSTTVSEWWSLMSSDGVTLGGVASAVALSIVAFLLAHAVADRFSETDSKPLVGARPTAALGPAGFLKRAAPTAAGIVLLFLISRPIMQAQLGDSVADRVRDLQVARLSSRDVDLLTRGYYENLNDVNRFNTELWEIYMKRPDDDYQTLRETPAGRLTGDFLFDEIVPLKKVLFKNVPLSTNRWGMRDRDYEQARPGDAYRIALLGGSFVAGSGVSDEETFEWVLEERLNRLNDGSRYGRYEILNFAVPGYSGIQCLMAMEKKALAFEPSAVFYTAHPREVTNTLRHIVGRVRAGVEIPYPYIREVVAKAGVRRHMPEGEAYRRLAPFGDEIMGWVYRRVAEICKERGIVAVSIYFPVPQPKENDPATAAHLMHLARDAGLQVVDIGDVYQDQDVTLLRIAEWDWHPNAKAHQLLAERILRALKEQAGIVPLPGVGPDGRQVERARLIGARDTLASGRN